MWPIRLLAAFCLFGACMSGLAAFTLTWPGTPLDAVWRVNPRGHAGLAAVGRPAAAGMALFCALLVATAGGLVARRRWAWWVACVALVGNALGDTVAAVVRGEPVTLIGLPLEAAVLWWLTRPRVRARFR